VYVQNMLDAFTVKTYLRIVREMKCRTALHICFHIACFWNQKDTPVIHEDFYFVMNCIQNA
jgi:hypothetical protein